jgi:NADH dehydrogenase FAD-containing subunit
MRPGIGTRLMIRIVVQQGIGGKAFRPSARDNDDLLEAAVAGGGTGGVARAAHLSECTGAASGWAGL